MSIFLDLSVELANEAGELLKEGFGSKIERSYKQDFSVLTKYDGQAEKIIIDGIRKNYPDHNILSEESGLDDKHSDYTWVIDPLDGTSNFAIGIPLFAVAISLVKVNQIIAATVYHPLFHNLITAEKGGGAFLNGKRASVSETDEVSKSLVSFSRGRSKEYLENFGTFISNIIPKVRTPRIYGTTVYELASVATGKFEGMIVYGAKPWDVYSGILLVREAGGKVTDFKGNEWEIGCDEYLVTNGKIHDEILDILRT